MKKKDSRSKEGTGSKKSKENHPKKKQKIQIIESKENGEKAQKKNSGKKKKTSTGQKKQEKQKAYTRHKDDAQLKGGRSSYRNSRHLFGAKMSEQLEHGENVSSLAYEVGRELGLSDEACNDLIVAGFFHDIGKAQISSATEGKNTMLVEEMNSVRQHPRVGYDILKRHGFSEEICRDVLYHHENMDGSGYPESLEGANIPLGACILRVCDVFCALIQDRPYRSAFPPETAMKMMIEEVEKYNLKVFLAFQRVLHRSPDGSISMPEVRPEVRGVWKKL